MSARSPRSRAPELTRRRGGHLRGRGRPLRMRDWWPASWAHIPALSRCRSRRGFTATIAACRPCWEARSASTTSSRGCAGTGGRARVASRAWARSSPRARLESAIESLSRLLSPRPARRLPRALLVAAGPAGRRGVRAGGGERREPAPGAQTLVEDLSRGHASFTSCGTAAISPAASANSSRRGLGAGIGRWTGELREIEAARRGEEDGAFHAIPAERFVLVVLDQLADGEREASYRGAARDARPWTDDAATRAFLERRLTPQEAGCGRWRERARGPAAWGARAPLPQGARRARTGGKPRRRALDRDL